MVPPQYTDDETMPKKEMVALVSRIAENFSFQPSADIVGGFGKA
ncbi:MAG: isocitrate lyase/phosphoenolpyruvate mutase family protein [Candidatus Thermoplasmatota archaeon]|nr:isocitrate lyase/phosphoenolpyruvate mutase family protein [Candidatus Thermoplasmatota archaeon]